MKSIPVVLLSGLLAFSSCQAKDGKGLSGKYETNPNGLEYQFFQKGDGNRTAKEGDLSEISVVFKIGDSLMINTNEINNNQPVPQPIQTPQMKGDLMEGLMMMKAGDSAVFRIRMDTLAARTGQPIPEWSKPEEYATWEVKMFSIKSQEEIEKETLTKNAEQLKKDDAILQEYFKKNHISNAKKTNSGLYYVITKENKGAAAPQAGQQVTVNYTGMNLEGKKFDSNVDPAFNHVQPFTFALGKRQVIAGWDEGIALLKKGEKATLYIPSSLAYGERGSAPAIQPNEVLIFEVEIVDFK